MPIENLGGSHWASLLVLERNFDGALEARSRTDPAYGLYVTLRGAMVRTILGDDAIAISLLDELLTVDSGAFLALVELNPTWDSLRDHPDYAAMIARHR